VRLSSEQGLDRRYVQRQGKEEQNKRLSSDEQLKLFLIKEEVIRYAAACCEEDL